MVVIVIYVRTKIAKDVHKMDMELVLNVKAKRNLFIQVYANRVLLNRNRKHIY